MCDTIVRIGTNIKSIKCKLEISTWCNYSTIEQSIMAALRGSTCNGMSGIIIINPFYLMTFIDCYTTWNIASIIICTRWRCSANWNSSLYVHLHLQKTGDIKKIPETLAANIKNNKTDKEFTTLVTAIIN